MDKSIKKKKYLKANDNENTTTQTLWNAVKVNRITHSMDMSLSKF